MDENVLEQLIGCWQNIGTIRICWNKRWNNIPEYGCDRLTVLSGGTVNGLFLREKLFDYVDIELKERKCDVFRF